VSTEARTIPNPLNQVPPALVLPSGTAKDDPFDRDSSRSFGADAVLATSQNEEALGSRFRGYGRNRPVMSFWQIFYKGGTSP